MNDANLVLNCCRLAEYIVILDDVETFLRMRSILPLNVEDYSLSLIMYSIKVVSIRPPRILKMHIIKAWT
jgi:hypothetical protein